MARGEPAIRDAEGGLRDGSGHRARGGRCGEGGAVAQRQKERDRRGGQGKADEPAAHRGTEAAAREARHADQRGRQDDLQDERVHDYGRPACACEAAKRAVTEAG